MTPVNHTDANWIPFGNDSKKEGEAPNDCSTAMLEELMRDVKKGTKYSCENDEFILISWTGWKTDLTYLQWDDGTSSTQPKDNYHYNKVVDYHHLFVIVFNKQTKERVATLHQECLFRTTDRGIVGPMFKGPVRIFSISNSKLGMEIEIVADTDDRRPENMRKYPFRGGTVDDTIYFIFFTLKVKQSC